MLKLLDRYVLKEIFPPFLLGLLVYTFAFLMKDILRFPEMIINQDIPPDVVFRLILYLIPSVLMFTVPMSVLLGILAGLSRMSSDAEVTALKTLGLGNGKLLRPILIFCVLGFSATSLLSHFLAPRFNFEFSRILSGSLQSGIQLIEPREFFDDIPETVIYIQDIDRSKTWKKVFVSVRKSDQDPYVIFADEGRINVYPEEKRAVLELFNAVSHTFTSWDPDRYQITAVSRLEEEIDYSVFEPQDRAKGSREKDTRELFRDLPLIEHEALNMAASGEFPALVQAKKREWLANVIEVHKRFAFPFACLIFAFLGIALGASTRKGGRTSGFTLSIGIILVYYILITAGERIAWHERLSPWLGIWGPNILFFLAGIIMFVRSRYESTFSPWGKRFRIKLRGVRPETRVGLAPRQKKHAVFRFPTTLDRYILRKFLFIFSLTFLSMLSVFIIVRFFERISSVYTHNKPLIMLFEYLWYSIPEFIHQVLPVTTLTAILLSLGIMTKFNEITAMKACGVSLYRMVLAPLLSTVLVCLGSLLLQEDVLPDSNKQAEEVWARINDRNSQIFNPFERNWVIGKSGDRIYHYHYFDPALSSFSRLSIYDLDTQSWALSRRFFAEKAELSGNSLTLSQAWKRTFHNFVPDEYVIDPDDLLVLEEDSGYFQKEWREPDQLSFSELKEYIRSIEESGFDSVRFRVDLFYKISFPLASLIMVFLGIPFAYSMGRRGALVGVGLSLIIAMIYWGMIGLFKSLGYADLMSAFLAAWAPNLIFGLIGIYLIFTVKT